MRVFIKIRQLPKLMPSLIPVLAILLSALLTSACGNKGDLFLAGSDRLIEAQIEAMPPIEDALDELEIMEAEEASASGVIELLKEKETS